VDAASFCGPATFPPGTGSGGAGRVPGASPPSPPSPCTEIGDPGIGFDP
jgi:hypothetical protein